MDDVDGGRDTTPGDERGRRGEETAARAALEEGPPETLIESLLEDEVEVVVFGEGEGSLDLVDETLGLGLAGPFLAAEAEALVGIPRRGY